MADYLGANSAATLDGNFKETYAKRIERLIPDGKKLTMKVPFLSRDKQPGNNYHQPVVLGMEHGVTHADPTEGAFALEAPIAGQIKDAVVKGYQLVLRSVMGYAQAQRSMGPGERAFEESTKFLVGNMMDSVAKKLEIQLLYGQMGYGTVLNPEAAAGTVVVEITPAEFAPGIWAGAEGMRVDFVRANALLAGASGVNAPTVTAVDLTARTITLTFPTPTALQANDIIFHKGAFGKEMAGVHKILTNTGSLFGIDASQYTLWKGSAFAPSIPSVLSFAILQQSISKGVEKGLDTDVLVMVNPGHWDDLLTQQSALRMYDSSYKSNEAENGSTSIKFHSQNGMVEIVPSIYVKEGYAYILCLEDWVRVGSTDITFERPGQPGTFFRELEDHAGFELRCYSDQAIFCAKPGRSVIVSNLVVG